LDFQVNKETYFLSLAENERQWRLFVATENGARPVPVYVDAPEFDEVKIMIEDDDKGKIVN
jgi:hypothetical protein